MAWYGRISTVMHGADMIGVEMLGAAGGVWPGSVWPGQERSGAARYGRHRGVTKGTERWGMVRSAEDKYGRRCQDVQGEVWRIRSS